MYNDLICIQFDVLLFKFFPNFPNASVICKFFILDGTMVIYRAKKLKN